MIDRDRRFQERLSRFFLDLEPLLATFRLDPARRQLISGFVDTSCG